MLTKTRMLLIPFLCILLLFSLNACGFKLGRQVNLPPQLQKLYLVTENPYGQFESALKQSLKNSGVMLVDSREKASLTLKVSKPTERSINTTIGSSNQARIYNIVYSTSFLIADNQGKTVVPPQTISTTRDLTLSANQLLDSNNQLTQLLKEMQRELIRKIYYRLGSKQISDMLQQAK